MCQPNLIYYKNWFLLKKKHYFCSKRENRLHLGNKKSKLFVFNDIFAQTLNSKKTISVRQKWKKNQNYL